MSQPAVSPAKLLLDDESISRTLSRIAHEIIERNHDLAAVALVGIHTRGVPLAQRLRRLVEERSGEELALGQLDITFHRDDVHVRAGHPPRRPQPLVRDTKLEFELEGRTVILVDDVLYTGRTIRAAIDALLATARSFAQSQERENKKLPTLRGRLILNVFYESSTRTSSSFELAAKRLSADTLTLKSSGSSVEKGESLKDTALTLSAYDPDVIVIRHPEAGAARFVADHTDARVVNAGDGKHQHPTQALLDLYAMREAFGRLDGLHVAIVGDVAHSRVARSLIQALRLVGADAVIVGPPALLPQGLAPASHDIASIEHADVVYVLRMQRERM